MAAGTRTASDITAAPSFRRLSWSMIGINDDKVMTKSVIVNAGATLVQLEAFAAAIAALSTASLFRLQVTDVFQGASLQSNATGDGRPSVDDNLIMTGKNNTQNQTRRVYVPAPVSEIFNANSENIIKDQALITALRTAWDAISAGYDSAWINFGEAQESNERQPF